MPISRRFNHPDKATAEQLGRIEDWLRHIAKEVRKLENQMATFEEDVARIGAALDAANSKLDAIDGDIAGLKAQIAAFPPAGLTAEQQAALEALAVSAEALAAKAADVDAKTP